MSDEWKKYAEDPRAICKYGRKCYQKNPQHLTKFKHPPDLKRKGDGCFPPPKQLKLHCDKPDQSHHIVSSQKSPNADALTDQDDVLTLDILSKPCSACNSVSDDIKETQLNNSRMEESEKFNISLEEISTEPAKLIKELFLVDMPDDFYSFWDFISKEKEYGSDILKMANLEAVGPYEVLARTLPKAKNKQLYLIHWRFFYDPPEFQTIITSKSKNEFHMGYFRDSPTEKAAFVASNDSSKNCTITPLADNIFGALYLHLQAEKSKSPFTATSYQQLIDKIKLWAEKHKFSLEKFDTRKRLASIAVTRTFHGAGIVVPYDKKTQLGYRPLVETDAVLKKMLAKLSSTDSKDKILSELQPVITYASIAMDECDFGTGLELGIDLFCSGLKELDSITSSTLSTAYSLLQRQAFKKIIEIHMKYRRKGMEMSIQSIEQ